MNFLIKSKKKIQNYHKPILNILIHIKQKYNYKIEYLDREWLDISDIIDKRTNNETQRVSYPLFKTNFNFAGFCFLLNVENKVKISLL